MGKLLIDEQPLQCQPSLAAVLGSADEAIVLQQLHYWLSRTNNVQSDGHKWIYNSMADWLKQFPWINSRNTLSGYFNDLEKRGLVITGNFNKVKFDKTKWYRINYDALTDLEQRLSEKHSSNAQKLSNGMPNDCASNDQELGNGTSKNEATYTNRLPETTTRDYQETTTADSAGVPTHEAIFNRWEDHWGSPSNMAQQDLNAWLNKFGAEIVLYTIEYAISKKVTSWGADKFLTKVFNRFADKGVKTVEAAKQANTEFDSRINLQHGRTKYGHQHIEEPLPDWAKKQNKPKKRPSKAFFDSLYDDEEG